MCHQFLVAFLIGLGNRQLGHALLDLCLRQLVVKLHQHLAFFNPLTIGEIQLRDAPADFRPQHHTPARPQTAHRLGVIRQAKRFNLGDLH